MPNYVHTINPVNPLKKPDSIPPPPAFANGMPIDRSKTTRKGPYIVGDRVKMIDSFESWYQKGEIAVLLCPLNDGTGWWLAHVPGREVCFFVSPDEFGRCWRFAKPSL